MNRTSGYLIGAVVLILIGVLLLLQNLGIIQVLEDVFWALAFAAAGVAFLVNFATSPRNHWWSVIPGMVLLALGALIGFESFLGDWAGALFLGAIAIAFWAVYLTQREFWWAVIPAGVLTTLAVVIGLEETIGDLAFGGVFFLGLGITFALVFLLPTKEETKWAIWPAGVLLVMGAIMVLATTDLLNWLWAVALIAAGLYLIVRALTTTVKTPKAPETPAPADLPGEPVAPAAEKPQEPTVETTTEESEG